MGIFRADSRGAGVISLQLAQEPAAFDSTVRKPGAAFLRRKRRPISREFSSASYWRVCLADLASAYNNICAYSCSYIPVGRTVDHFHPKSVRPDLAYEWRNFRLASEKLNSYKGNSTDILDPCNMGEDWFTLDFDTFFVRPAEGLRADARKMVERTIHVLRLNRDDSLVENRFLTTELYARGQVTIRFLDERYPFISRELRRQNMLNTIQERFRSV